MDSLSNGNENRKSIRTWLLLLLALAGFLNVLASSINSNIEWVPTNLQFGLFQILPLGYWLGVGLIGLSIVLGFKQRNELLFITQALLLFISIWGVISLFERFPSYWDVYGHYLGVSMVMSTGSTISSGPFTYVSNYPGFFVASAVYSFLGNIDPLKYLLYYPLFSATFTLIAFYLFSRTYLSIKDYRVAMLISILANVWIQLVFNPQSLGLAVGIMALVALEKDSFRWQMVSLAAFTYVVLSHPTTVPFVLGALLLSEVMIRLPFIRRFTDKSSRPWAILLFILVWLAWLSFGARNYSRVLLQLIVERLRFMVEIPEATGRTIVARVSENIFTVAPQVRTAMILATGAVLVICLCLYLTKKARPSRRIPAIPLALCLLGAIMVPLDLVLMGAQLYDRGILYFMFCAPSVIAIVLFSVPKLSRNWHRLRQVIMGILLTIAVVCSFTAYYQESMNVVSDRTIKASEFFYHEMPEGSSVVGGAFVPVIWGDPRNPQFSGTGFFGVYPEPFRNLTRTVPTAIVFDRSSVLWHQQWGTIFVYDYYLGQMDNATKVYESGAYHIFYGRPG